jgi:hypothetical protein
MVGAGTATAARIVTRERAKARRFISTMLATCCKTPYSGTRVAEPIPIRSRTTSIFGRA